MNNSSRTWLLDSGRLTSIILAGWLAASLSLGGAGPVAADHAGAVVTPTRDSVDPRLEASNGWTHSEIAGQEDGPTEFFMSDPAPRSSLGDSGVVQEALHSAVDPAAATSAAPINSTAETHDAGPAEFFMLDEAAWLPVPEAGPDDAHAPLTAPSPPRNTTQAPLYLNAGDNWNSVPSSPSPSPVQSSVWHECFNAACCAWEYRWVNWRLGSDYLQGCMPDGYNGLPIISATSPTAIYSAPFNQNGPVEPGGSFETSPQSPALERKCMTELTADISVTPEGLPVQSPPAFGVAQEARTHHPGTHRAWNGMNFYWDASHLAHQPLYFEDVNLERNGYSCGVAQPFVSAARFFGRIPLLPYALAVHPHYEVQYALGEPRPGSPAPYVHVRPPLSARGALMEAAVVTGLFFAIP